MEKQQTTVEWLVNQMKQRESQGLTLSMYELEMFGEKAKKMENQEKISLLEWIRFNANEVPNGWQFDGVFYTDEEILNQFKK